MNDKIKDITERICELLRVTPSYNARLEIEDYLQLLWDSGVADSIKLVEQRKEHYEFYRNTVAMKTHPAVFAILDEMLVLLGGMKSRGEIADRIKVD